VTMVVIFFYDGLLRVPRNPPWVRRLTPYPIHSSFHSV